MPVARLRFQSPHSDRLGEPFESSASAPAASNSKPPADRVPPRTSRLAAMAPGRPLLAVAARPRARIRPPASAQQTAATNDRTTRGLRRILGQAQVLAGSAPAPLF